MAALEPNYDPDPDATVLPTSNRSMAPLSARTVAIVALSVLIVTAGAILGLLWWVNARGLTGTELTAACLDAIKIGLSIAVGGGGIFALYLAWRRQRSNEADHQQRERSLLHQQQVADDTKHDALERRITDLYTKAADQLGSDKAPVRLAGIYALERLAQNDPDQRQTIVNLLCAYLRMPYDPSLYVVYRANRKLGKPASCKEEIMREDFSADTDTRDRSIQESEVRLTAQRVLTKHLNPSPRTAGKHADPGGLPFWPGTDLDLTGAVLIDFDVMFCHLGHTKFDHAQFIGPAMFRHVQTDLFITFTGATFTDKADFIAVDFPRVRYSPG
jgi:hypothetical protein